VICIPIMAETQEAVLAQMGQAFALADIVELRIDRMRNVDLGRLIGARRGKIIVTNRRREEGGGFEGSERERVDLLKQAVALGADYVDVEWSTDGALRGELIQAVRNHSGRVRLIVSCHDLERTPPVRELDKRLRGCFESGADIAKIVTLARSPEDNLRMLRLLAGARKKGQAVIAFCMGDQGRPSRALAPLFGSPMSYAALAEGEASAPGQWTVQEMRTLMKLLRHEAGM
jgi:3-dehydroquinate dehydratase type I